MLQMSRFPHYWFLFYWNRKKKTMSDDIWVSFRCERILCRFFLLFRVAPWINTIDATAAVGCCQGLPSWLDSCPSTDSYRHAESGYTQHRWNIIFRLKNPEIRSWWIADGWPEKKSGRKRTTQSSEIFSNLIRLNQSCMYTRKRKFVFGMNKLKLWMLVRHTHTQHTHIREGVGNNKQ